MEMRLEECVGEIEIDKLVIGIVFNITLKWKRLTDANESRQTVKARGQKQ